MAWSFPAAGWRWASQGGGGRRTLIAVQLTVLGSGSEGNATLLAHSCGCVLLDAGLSYRELKRRLEHIGADPDRVRAILITHGHGDHVRGAGLFSRRHGARVYATPPTRAAWGGDAPALWEPMQPGSAVDVSGFMFHPFAVPHDDMETLAFRIETPEGAIGFATDLGCITRDLVERCRGCVMLVLEANHAGELLRVSPYVRSVRERIGSDRGHLSNEALAAFLGADLDGSVRCLVLAHLSRMNNVPEIAELACREALARRGRPDVRLIVAHQNRPSPTVDLATLWPAGVPAAIARGRFRQHRLPL